MSVQIVDPRGSVSTDVDVYELRLGEGATRLALLSNTFPDASTFLSLLGNEIRALDPHIAVKLYEKQTAVGAAGNDLVASIVAEADAVVAAYGH
jgi:hypothetical protein